MKKSLKVHLKRFHLNDLEWSYHEISSKTQKFFRLELPDFIVCSLRKVKGKVQNVQLIDNITRKCYCITFIEYEVSTDTNVSTEINS